MPAIALLGIPWDGDSSWKPGAARAPAAIRAELERVRRYSTMLTESGVDLDRPGLLSDEGDVACGPDSATTRAAIQAAVTRQLDAGREPLSLGGDHSVSYPILRAVHARLGRVDVLHFDAHPDLYDEFEGNRYSHACPFARALEDGLIGRLAQVGIRAASAAQRALAEAHGVEMTTMADWRGPPRLELDRPVYISLDLDVLDPAFAPAVSHPEPGGLSVRDVVAMIQRLEGRVIGADLVEYNPDADPEGRTAVVAVKLLKELAAAMVR
jgi:arginase